MTRAFRKRPHTPLLPDMAGAEAALRKLKPRAVPSEQDIAAVWSRAIPSFVQDFSQLMVPDQPAPSKGVTEAQLANVEKKGEALLRSLMSLQGPAVDALHSRFHDLTLGEFMEMLQRLITAASGAPVPEESTDREGPKFREQPRKIAALAAQCFYRLTGRPPTRSKNRGEFPDFLAELFKVFRVEASVELHAREAVSACIKRRSVAGE